MNTVQFRAFALASVCPSRFSFASSGSGACAGVVDGPEKVVDRRLDGVVEGCCRVCQDRDRGSHQVDRREKGR